jgi:hypothetical protein
MHLALSFLRFGRPLNAHRNPQESARCAPVVGSSGACLERRTRASGPVHPYASLPFLRCVSSGHLDVHLHGLRSKGSVKRNFYNLQAAWDFESPNRAPTIHDITLAHEYTYPTRPIEIIDAKSFARARAGPTWKIHTRFNWLYPGPVGSRIGMDRFLTTLPSY